MPTFPAALPHGPLTRVADRIHTLRGRFRMGAGMIISRTMTVIEGDDGLVVVSAIRLSDAGHAELDALGRVRHLIKLGDAHGIDDPYYVDRYAPQIWTLPGARLVGIGAGRRLGPDGPIAGGTVVDYGTPAGQREAAYRIPYAGGTLITCDAIQNCVDSEGASLMIRLVTPLLGFTGGVIVPRMWRRKRKLAGTAVRDTLGGLLPLTFANLVTGHGPAVVGGADEAVWAAIAHASR
ncbi:MAG: hypothetical protein H6709_13870 [Kofleriaceae bacterium]|nr:hypothetical protein [Myxococcales bacterium]MCB9561999.1 hypothetical protein [Kofleriaceae bacterium]MCB9573167.1 hypothetical protein [Kofleriaceae bacterium]